MAVKTTDIADLVPEILAEAIQGEFAQATVLYGTGAASVSFSMPMFGPGGGVLKAGKKIVVPYFGTIGEMEELIEGNALTPAGLVSSSEEATIRHFGKAVEITEWAQFAANYADPYGEMARQFSVITTRKADALLLEAAAASLSASYIKDISTDALSTISYDTLVDAKMLWGDEQNDIVLFTCHSGVFKNLLKLKDSTGRPLLVTPESGKLPRLFDIPVAVSDKNTYSGGKYRSKILKRNALAFWANEAPRVKQDEDILADSMVAAIHLYGVAHRYARTAGGTKPGVAEIVSTG